MLYGIDNLYRLIISVSYSDIFFFNVTGISINGSEFVNKGEPLMLECKATGFNQVSNYLEWYKDGKIIDNSYIWKHHRLRGRAMNITDYHNIDTKTLRRVLYIARSTMEDSGTYMCRISPLDIAKKTVHVLDGE